MASTADAEKGPYDNGGSPVSYDRHHEGTAPINEDRLRRSLSARQVQMIAIGKPFTLIIVAQPQPNDYLKKRFLT